MEVHLVCFDNIPYGMRYILFYGQEYELRPQHIIDKYGRNDETPLEAVRAPQGMRTSDLLHQGEEAQPLATQHTNTCTTHTQQTEHGDQQNATWQQRWWLETSLSMQKFLVVSSGGMAAV